MNSFHDTHFIQSKIFSYRITVLTVVFYFHGRRCVVDHCFSYQLLRANVQVNFESGVDVRNDAEQRETLKGVSEPILMKNKLHHWIFYIHNV